jgi:hypothetical protein
VGTNYNEQAVQHRKTASSLEAFQYTNSISKRNSIDLIYEIVMRKTGVENEKTLKTKNAENWHGKLALATAEVVCIDKIAPAEGKDCGRKELRK